MTPVKNPQGLSIRGLIDDPRYQEMSWEEKSVALDRFSEKFPSPKSGPVKQIERLSHFSEDGNLPDRKLNGSLLEARRQWFRTTFDEGNQKKADAEFDTARSKAAEVWKEDARRRQEDLDIALDLVDTEKNTSFTSGNVLEITLQEMDPRTKIQRLLGKETEADIENTIDHGHIKDLKRILGERGYDEAGIETLKRDATLASSGSGTSADVDSQGNIAINDGVLVRDIDSVRKAISGLDAADSVKKSKLASLEDRRRKVIDTTFAGMVKGGGARWSVGDDGKASDPVLSPNINIKTIVPEFTSLLASPITGTSSPERRGEAAGVARSAEKFEKDEVAALEKEFGWTFEKREKAVIELLGNRDDALDRARVGLSHGLLGDLAAMAITPFEIAGADFAKEIAEDNERSRQGFAAADKLNEISGMAEFVELGARIAPQIFLTRGAGSLGGKLASTRNAALVTQRRIATTFATGFGGLQSATFNARDVLDNEGSSQDALAAGILGFGTTFLISNGFNAIGAGGVEDFRRTATSASSSARSQLVQRIQNISKGAVGEGVEEFVDEFINGLITQDFTGASSDALASNAFKAALIGGGFGGAFGATKKTVETITPSSTDEEVSIAADQALEDLQRPQNNRLQDVDTRITTLENRDTLDETEQDELDSLIQERKGLTSEPEIDLDQTENPEIVLESEESSAKSTDAQDIKVGDTVSTSEGDAQVESVGIERKTIDGVTTTTRNLRMSNGTTVVAVDGGAPIETRPEIVLESAPEKPIFSLEEVSPKNLIDPEKVVKLYERLGHPANTKSSRVRLVVDVAKSSGGDFETFRRRIQRNIDANSDGQNLQRAGAVASIVDFLKAVSDVVPTARTDTKKNLTPFEKQIRGESVTTEEGNLTVVSTTTTDSGSIDTVTVSDGDTETILKGEEAKDLAQEALTQGTRRRALEELGIPEPEPLSAEEQADVELELAEATAQPVAVVEEAEAPADTSPIVKRVKSVKKKIEEQREESTDPAVTVNEAAERNIAEATSDPVVEEPAQKSHNDLKKEATLINDLIKLNRQRGLYPSLAEVEPIRLNSSKADLASFIGRYKGTENDAPPTKAAEEPAQEQEQALSEAELGEIRGSVRETLEEVSEDAIPQDQREEFQRRIDAATVDTDLTGIQQEILDAALELDAPVPRANEEVDVDEFLATATAFQKEQFTERFVKGEDPVAIATELSSDGSSEILSDSEIVETLDDANLDSTERAAREIEGNSGQPLVMYSMLLPDPQLVLDTAKSLYRGIKSFIGFAKRMIEGFGDRVRPILGRLFKDLKRTDGNLEASEVISEQPVETDTAEEAEAEAADRARQEAGSGPAGIEAPTSESDIDTPDTAIPLISRETAVTLGQDKQSLVNLIDKTTAWKPVKAVLDYMGSLFNIPISNTKLLLQNVKDFAPNIAIAANAFSMSTLQSEAKVMRSLLEQKFPDLETKDDGKGNIEILGVLRKDGGPTPKYFSDLAEAIQEDFEAFDFASDNVRDFFREVVRYNQFAIKMAESEGVVLAEVQNEDGTGIDMTKLNDVRYAPRGRVTHRQILDNPKTHGDHKSRMALTGARGQRKFTTEQEGIDAGYIYSDHPFDRLVNQITSTKAMVYNQRLFSDSNFRSVAVPLTRQEIVEELVDPETGEVTVKKRTVRKGNEKLEDVVRLGPLSMRATLADAKTIQASIDRIHSSNGFLNAMADAASVPSKLTLAVDMSAMFNQLLHSLFTNPKGWARAISLSSQDLVGKRDKLREEIAGRADYIKLAVQHGGQWATIAEEFIDNRAQAEILERQRSGSEAVGRKAVRPLQRVFTKFGEFQGLMQSLAASYTFEADIIRLKAEGKFTPENIGLAAKSADNIHGRENLTRYGLSHNAVTLSRAVLTAAGMYAGFTAVVLDLASSNKQIQRNAIRRLGLFATGAHITYFLLAMSAEMIGEDEDNETTLMNKAKKIGRRMIPGAKDYLTMDVQIGNGTKKLAWGGFYRGLMNAVTGSMAQNLIDTLGFENANTDRGTVDRLGNFMGGKIRNSFQMTEQLITGEDYFNNPATMVETLRANLIPLSAGPTAVAATDPVLTYLHKNTGLDLVTLERIAEEKPDLKLSIFDTISNFVGINGYVEGDAAKFNRALDKESKGQHGKRYDELTMAEARSVRAELNRQGLKKPAFKGKMDSIIELNRKRFRKDLGGRRFNSLDNKTIDSLSARIPFNVVMKSKEEATRIPAELREKMRSEIIPLYQEAIDSGLRNDALRTKAKDVVNKVRVANGLPKVRD